MPLWWNRAYPVHAEQSSTQAVADGSFSAEQCLNCKYHYVKTLGGGAFGEVIEVEEQDTGKRFAIKRLPRCSFKPCHQSEILIQRRLNHPHIIKLREVFLTEQHVCIVMDRANGGNMFDYVQRQGCLSEALARWFFQQLVLAVDYCHAKGVANRDIKLENILLQYMPGMRQPLLRLCDFGYSKELDAAPCSVVGTFAYMAPEVMSNHHCIHRGTYDARAAELWSCGVTLYAMLVGQYPFPHEPCYLRQAMQAMEQQSFKLPKRLSEECRSLLRALLHPDPAQRITMEGITQHPWFLQGLPAAALDMTQRYLPIPPKCQQTETELLGMLAEVYVQQDHLDSRHDEHGLWEQVSNELDTSGAVATFRFGAFSKWMRAAA